MKTMAALVLAAGASTRFGSPKQLAMIGDKTLLQNSIDTANQVLPGSVTVVLGAHYQQIASTVSAATVIVNSQWQAGLGCSIALGVSQIEQTCQAILVLLADQPRIQGHHLKAMCIAFTGDNIVCATYQGKRGVPAVFPGCCFSALKQLSGDQGAKRILQQTRTPVVELALPEAGFDIDTVVQLTAANTYYEQD